MTRPLRAMLAAIQESEVADGLLGGPCAGLRDVAEMLDRSAQLHWRGFQHAISDGDRERADVLEQRARLYEELAELCRAHAWKPPTIPALTAEERAELGRMFDRLLADPVCDELAERARRANSDEPRGPRYALAALEREAEIVRAAALGIRNETLSRSAWSLARLVCDGTINDGDVFEALVPAATSTGLGAREAHGCIRAALRRRCAA
jgi:hypothetical protein